MDEVRLKNHQIAALERMAQKGDGETFAKHARHFKETWGEPELLFGGDILRVVEKIKAAQIMQEEPKPPARRQLI